MIFKTLEKSNASYSSQKDASKLKASCCSTQNTATVSCPNCHSKGQNVDGVTIKAQLQKSLRLQMHLGLDAFNFCTSAKCDTVYYSNDGSLTYKQADIKSKVTLKNSDPKTPLCYCRKLLKAQVIKMIENKESNIAEKIKEIIASGKSICEKSNPKGVCCTEDIKNFLASYDISWEETKKQMFSMNPPSQCCT